MSSSVQPALSKNQQTSAAARNDSPELRTKIVEILSLTANGCLSELGYYPGIAQQLHEALKANSYLQQANNKLFEDNGTLARHVALQNDRLALVDGAENSRLKRYIDMESMVKVLTAEKAELAKRNSLLVQGLPTSDIFVAELKNLQISHDKLQREYLRLRESYNSLYKTSASRGILPTKQVPSGHSPEGSNSNYHIPNANTNTHVNHRRASDGQVPVATMASSTNQWQLPLTTQHHKAPSQRSYAQRSVSGQEPNRSHAGPSLQHARRPSSGTTSFKARHQEISAPVSDGVGQMYSNAQKGKGKDPLTPLSLDARNLPTTPGAHRQGPHQHSIVGWSPAAQADQSQQNSTASTEEAPAHEYVTKEPTVQVPMTLDGDVANEDIVMSPPASSAEVPFARIHGAPTTAPVNPAQEDGVDQQQRFAQESTNVSGESSLAVDPNSSQEEPQAVFDTAMHADIMAEYAGPEQGDAMHEEALVSEEECVATIFEEDEEIEGKQICNLCTMRFERGLVEEPPEVYMHAALDILVAHCVEEHLVVWEKLRHSPPDDD